MLKKVETNLNFVLCADFIAHTSDIPDFAPDDNITDSFLLPDDYVIDTSLKRISQTGFRILNGRNE